ncbi:MAG TPA: molybdopterin-dependent oxidoreductase, partial [Hyphomicrobiales bacterium]|nr:molybdopterin-dependent oxidoreductase [Hyphomicrobiales bacterium]
ISDKSRFVYDGLRVQRLDQPYVRKRNKLQPASWQEAFSAIAARVNKSAPEKIAAIAGDLATAEEMFAFKDLMGRLGVTSIDCRQDGAALDPANGRASYLFNATIEGIEEADALLLIGTNPRWEASVLNARIRTRWRRGGFPVGVIGGIDGAGADLTYDYEYLGAGADTLADLAAGNGSFAKLLKEAEKPLIIVGQGALARSDGAAILGLAAKAAKQFGALSEGWNGFSVLHTAASRVAGLDLGLVPGEGGRDTAAILEGAAKGDIDIVFLLGADEIPADKLGEAFIVYQGTHGDRGAHRADVILPGAAYTEKSGTYVNTEGRVQLATRAVFPPGDAREDWAILRALSDVLGQRLPYDNLPALRAAMYEAHPHLAEIDAIIAGDPADIERLAEAGDRTGKSAFASPIADFYLTNPIARASAVMAQLSALAQGRSTKVTGTDG